MAVWPVGLGGQGWPGGSIVDYWADVGFTAPNSLAATIGPGISNGTVSFELAGYGRILVQEPTLVRHTVTFVVDPLNINNSVSPPANPPEQSVPRGGMASRPADPVWQNLVFIGWFPDLYGGTQWNFDADPVLKGITLYARWEWVAYTHVMYIGAGGEMIKYSVAIGSVHTVLSPEGLGLADDPWLVFDSWNTLPDGTGTTYAPGDQLTIEGSVVLHFISV